MRCHNDTLIIIFILQLSTNPGHSRTMKIFKTAMKEGFLYVENRLKQVVHSYSFEISAQVRTLKSSMDCADTVLAGNAYQSRIADGKKAPW